MPALKPWIYGTVPEPVGGVSVFLMRLINSIEHAFEGLVDPYYARQKTKIPIKHICAKHNGMLERSRVTSHLIRLRHLPLFVNGSRPESILSIAPFVAFAKSSYRLDAAPRGSGEVHSCPALAGPFDTISTEHLTKKSVASARFSESFTLRLERIHVVLSLSKPICHRSNNPPPMNCHRSP